MEGSTSKCKDGQIMVLEHEHPLELVDLQPKRQHSEETDDDDEDDMVPEFRGTCGRCSQVISEYHMYYYKCVDSCDYSLHKFCAELPPELEHTVHVHPLVIRQYKQISWKYCDECKSDHKHEEIAYTCPTTNCYFAVDVNCVLGVEETKINHPSHPNQLVSTFSKPSLCVCDACGTKHEGIFYRCSICSFAIHSDCAFLPRNLQIQKTTDDKFYHTHPLTLSYSFSRTDQGVRYYPKCRVCGIGFGFSDRRWVYKCEKCWYYTHLNCATSRTEPFMSILSSSGLGKQAKNYINAQHPDLLHLPFIDQNHNIQKHMFSTKFVSESSTRTDEGDPKHTIHPHPLILVDAQSKQMTVSTSSAIKPLPCHDPLKKIELLCNACVRPIMDVPYYMCSNEDQHCNFAIHEWCTRLPTTLEHHPIHQNHELVLLTNVRRFFSVFKCDICDLGCNGFAYYCVQCNYCIDVTCGLIPNEITHDSHPNHLLKILKKTDRYQECKACSNYLYGEYSFSCESCHDFNMHIECALLLPKTVRHRYDKKHAFNLSYFPVENHPAEYFCDVCESSLNPSNRFFYHCNDCDKSMHLACAPMMFHWETPFRDYYKRGVNRYINIKFRGSHSIKDHPHPLSFVQGLASDGNCTRCDKKLQYELIFKCSQCEFAIDYDCCEWLSNYRDEDEGSDDEELSNTD